MGRVLHFEIHADDVDRAKAFYADAFGWTFEDYGPMTGSTYWGISTGDPETPGIDGGLLRRPAPAPDLDRGPNAFVCTVVCDDYDETERRILAAGGRVALPKMPLTGMAWQGYYVDTEGNTFGIHQPDERAGLEG